MSDEPDAAHEYARQRFTDWSDDTIEKLPSEPKQAERGGR